MSNQNQTQIRCVEVVRNVAKLESSVVIEQGEVALWYVRDFDRVLESVAVLEDGSVVRVPKTQLPRGVYKCDDNFELQVQDTETSIERLVIVRNMKVVSVITFTTDRWTGRTKVEVLGVGDVRIRNGMAYLVGAFDKPLYLMPWNKIDEYKKWTIVI